MSDRAEGLSPDRTPEGERLVRWRYYLDMGIAMLKQPQNDLARTTLVHSGYEDPVEILTDLATALFGADVSYDGGPVLNVTLGPAS